MKASEKTALKLYNSLSNQKEVFRPIVPGFVGMYVCGPTVYSGVHLGNVRTFVSFDLVFRYLKHLGYKVRYVRNITDVGHLENDADTGEDRIAKKARLEQLEPMEVAQRYTVDFHNVLQKFNTLPPSIEPTATGHILEQIELVKGLVERGIAYEVNGSVYFDVMHYDQDENYGILSGRNIEDSTHNTRSLDGQSEKKNPQDFALWKKARPEHIMRWPSPWSDGFPGWHLECTAMSTKYLGEQFDIHGGGMDLKFPHHECEIAQATCVHGKPPVNYWMHANMLTLNGQKMAKSTGNNILPEEIFSGTTNHLSKAFSPATVRFFMLQAHYRSNLDFSSAALEASEKGFQKLMESQRLLKSLPTSKNPSLSQETLENWTATCYAAMNDDFNSPILIAQLFEGVRYIHLIHQGTETISEASLALFSEVFNNFIFDVLGLENGLEKNHSTQLEGTVSLLIQLRNQAREQKNWALSDQIRDALLELDIELKDGKNETSYTLR